MRVAVFTTQFPSVSQTFVLSQVTGLLDRGHEVTVFARAPDEITPEHADVARYGLAARTRHWPESAGSILTALGRGGAARTGLRALLKSSPIDKVLPRALLPLAAVTAAREAPFDAVLCHFGHQGLLAQWLREVGAIRGPLAVIFHGYDISSYVERNGGGVYARLFERAELLLPISENWRRRLIELGAPESKLSVLRMGIDTRRFELAPRTRGAGEPVRALTVARLVEKKGIEYALRSLARARQRGVPVSYTVAGDGPLLGRLRALTRELGLEAHVEFAGWCDQEAIVRHLARAHVLLAPSVTAQTGDQEGVPVVLMEAMAGGLPVLSTRHSGIPELVPDELLVDERDVEGLADRLVALVENEARWSTLGAELRARVVADFDAERLNDRLVALLEGLRPSPQHPAPGGP